jgi:hypothetical protein
MPHIAGTRRMATNLRFGQPGRNPRHPQDPAWQADLFPFTYATLSDPLTGRTDGLLRRCSLNASCPKVMQTDSEHEWWASHASLLVTDLQGNHLDLPDNVRAYMIAGTPHFAGPDDRMHTEPAMALPKNPMHSGAPMRALLTDLNSWIRDGVTPPASRVPTRAQGTLVPAEGAVPTNIPGLPYAARYTTEVFSDQSVLPPKEIGSYPVFVPRADTDGIAISGVHLLALAVPRATYTGWNPRAQGFGGPTAFYPLQGAVLPFAPTEAARKDANDPRPSIEARYANDEAYVAAVKREAARAVAERLLLEEDAVRSVEAAKMGTLAKLGQ